MFTKLGRTVGAMVAGSAAIAMAVAMAPAASAVTPNSDNFIPSVLSASTHRVAGSDRIATAIKAAQTRVAWGWWAGNTFVDGCNVILARDDAYPDALVSGPLAGERSAPILVNPTGVLDNRVGAEIAILKRQCVDNNGAGSQLLVTIVGGKAAISDGIANYLMAQGYGVERLQGIDRYQTAIAVGRKILAESKVDGLHDTNVFLATGENFPDALAAGATAAQKNGIVLLTRANVMDPLTKAYMLEIANDVWWTPTPTVYAVGGPAAAASPDSLSYIGVDRYQTASKLADAFFQFLPSDGRVQNVGVASGENYADAVIAAGFMANGSGGPLLLTHKVYLDGVSSDYLFSQRDWVDHAFVFGGTAVVDPGVATSVSDALFN